MRLSLRFVLPLVAALAALAYALVPVVDRLMLGWASRDLELRASVIARTAQERFEAIVDSGGGGQRLTAYFTRLTADERLYAVGYCAPGAVQPIATLRFPSLIRCDSLDGYASGGDHRIRVPDGTLHVAVPDLDSGARVPGRLVFVHDMSFVDRRSADTRRYLFYLFIALGLLVSLITVVVAQLSWRGWLHGMRALLRGDGALPRAGGRRSSPELQPVAQDLRSLLRDIEAAHATRDAQQIAWTPESLRALLHDRFGDLEVIVVSNREPYLHQHDGPAIRVKRPASGVVTALEPVMRACQGTWIAHGSADADRAVVDRHDRIRVPPDAPAYTLRRVWLTPEEEQGYYYGFANEGLWPLCHIAHARPTFRSSDWAMYNRANQRFAHAVSVEARTPDPIVLVQDYHFALAPRMIRELMPRATILTFWHIPWPNPESFAICPWREELLDGLLGSSILGFHTQFHCNNFVDTVDRLLEARVDRETFAVSYQQEETAVRRYPISIEWPPPQIMFARTVSDCRAEIRAHYGLPAAHAVGIGVDRLDYTKGIEERFRAVEKLFEGAPDLAGRFTFVQIAAPSRSEIREYQVYEQRVRAVAAEINARFGRTGAPAIVLRVEHLEPPDVYAHYRGADLCFVSSLHDGMNLVAKEFVASRDDERGVLVLSRFTGAARELPEAIIVNPYDADECARALRVALEMPEGEQRDRMRLMRGLLRDFSVFRWAGRMLIDAMGRRRDNRRRQHAVPAAL